MAGMQQLETETKTKTKGKGKGNYNPNKQQIDETTTSFRNFIRRFRNSPYTKKSYTHWLRKFIEYCNREEVVSRTGVVVGNNTDKLLLEDTRKIENLVKDYLDYQAEVLHLAPKTISTHYDGIRQFYRSNRITLYGDTKDYVGSYSNIKSNVDMPYDYDQIHKILDKCDERKRVIVLLLCSTGMRRGAIPNLKVGDLKFIEEYGIYEITVYKGYPEEYKTYCSLECASAISSYLDFRRRVGEDTKPDSYLIRKQFNREDPRHTGPDTVTISLPTDPPEKHKIGMSNIETIIYQLVCDAGIRTSKVDRLGGRHKNMAAHAFRKFFENKCLEAGVDPFFVSVLMGHKAGIGVERHYYRPDSIQGENSLLELYVKKALPYLTISDESRLKLKNRELEMRMAEDERRFKAALEERDNIVKQREEEWLGIRKEIDYLKKYLPAIKELNEKHGL